MKGQRENLEERAVLRELQFLRALVSREPSNWALGRIAELEGWLTERRERAAWQETRRIIDRLLQRRM